MAQQDDCLQHQSEVFGVDDIPINRILVQPMEVFGVDSDAWRPRSGAISRVPMNFWWSIEGDGDGDV